jgi:hypothetical protein
VVKGRSSAKVTLISPAWRYEKTPAAGVDAGVPALPREDFDDLSVTMGDDTSGVRKNVENEAERTAPK